MLKNALDRQFVVDAAENGSIPQVRRRRDVTKSRILIGCLGIPEFGGASAVAYALHKLMLDDGVVVALLNFVEEADLAYCRYVWPQGFGNPLDFENVTAIELCGSPHDEQPQIHEFAQRFGADVLLGVGSAASVILQNAAPEVCSAFLTTSWHHPYSEKGRRPVKMQRADVEIERAGVTRCDMIIPHSPVVATGLRDQFPAFAGKLSSEVLSFADWVRKDIENYGPQSRPFAEREVDLLFVARDWRRDRANMKTMWKLAKQYSDLRVQIIGEGGECENAAFRSEITSRTELLSLMGNSKVCVVPTLQASAPFVIYEARAMGCNVVTSRDCGNWRCTNESLVAQSPTVTQLLPKVRAALRGPLETGRELAEHDPYAALLEITTVLRADYLAQ